MVAHSPQEPGSAAATGGTRRGLSMRGYLLVMVIAILLPVIIFAGILFQRYYDADITRIERELQNEAHDLALLVDRDLEGQLVALETLTTSGSLAGGQYDRFYQRAVRMRDYAHVDILLRDRSGQQLVNTRLPWGEALPRDSAEGDEQVAATNKPYISNVIVGTVAKRPIYYITVPIVKDGTVAFFLHMSLELNRLVDL